MGVRLVSEEAKAGLSATVPQGESNHVTVTFVVMQDLTAYYEKFDSERLRAFARIRFEALVPIIRKYKGLSTNSWEASS